MGFFLSFFFNMIKNIIFIYFIVCFNILYYFFFNKLYINMYKYKTKIYVYFILYIFIHIILFIIYYILLIIYLFEIFYLKYYLRKYIYILEFHYSILKEIYLINLKKFNTNNILILDFYCKFSILLKLNYIFYFIEKLYNIVFDYYIWVETYFIRFYRKIKNNEKYTIKYNLLLYKKIYIDKIKNIKKKIKSKIVLPNKMHIKMSINYHYNKFKRLFFYLYHISLLKIKEIILEIKIFYFLYFIHLLFFYILKNNGNKIIYYIFLCLKYFKSFLMYIWKSDKIYKFLKKLERKKW